MKLRHLAILLLSTSCKKEVREVCSGRSDADCEATEGCHLGLAQPVDADAESGFACWGRDPVVAACVPDLPEDRCPHQLVKAAPPGGAPCLLFDSPCTPEGWGTCSETPQIGVCPACAVEDLPPYVAPDFTAGGAAAFGRWVAAGDLDADGKADVVIGSNDGLVLLMGPVSETSARLRVSSGDLSTDAELVAAIGDLTGDGVADLVVGGRSARRGADTGRTGVVWILEGPITEDVMLSDAVTRIEGGQVGDELGAWVHVSDLDGDGEEDLLAWAARADAVETRAGVLAAWYGPVAPGVSRTDSADASLGGRLGFGAARAVGQLNGETSLVVAVGRGQVGLLTWPWIGALTVDDLPLWLVTSSSQVPSDIAVITLGDVTGDGKVDLIWAPRIPVDSAQPGGEVLISAGPPPGEGLQWETTATLSARCTPDGLGEPLRVDDLNGDGVDDLLLGESGQGNVAGLLRLGPIPAGEQQAATDASRLGPLQWGSVWSGDLDGDGGRDLVVGDPTATEVRVWRDPAR